jgi:hypothetical protein
MYRLWTIQHSPHVQDAKKRSWRYAVYNDSAFCPITLFPILLTIMDCEGNAMAIMKGPTEGGSGGKRGHSNMEHWIYSHEVKRAAKKKRRLESKKKSRDALKRLRKVI